MTTVQVLGQFVATQNPDGTVSTGLVHGEGENQAFVPAAQMVQELHAAGMIDTAQFSPQGQLGQPVVAQTTGGTTTATSSSPPNSYGYRYSFLTPVVDAGFLIKNSDGTIKSSFIDPQDKQLYNAGPSGSGKNVNHVTSALNGVNQYVAFEAQNTYNRGQGNFEWQRPEPPSDFYLTEPPRPTA